MVATSKNEPNAAVSSKVEALYDKYPFPPGTFSSSSFLLSRCVDSVCWVGTLLFACCWHTDSDV